jgi:serine/threonine protein phosphatase PrpC
MEKTMVETLPEGAYWREDKPPTGISVIGHTNGVSGIGKIRDGIPSHNTSLAVPGGKAYGEDSAWIASQDVGEDKAVTMALCDGHGLKEWQYKTSRRVVEMHAQWRAAALTRRLALVRDKDVDTLVREETEHFRAIHEAMGGKPSSGCTASMVDVCLLSHGRIIVIASNVGDSPILIVCNKTGRVVVLHQAHNWDNPTEYLHHIKYRTAKGQTPCTPCYSRFNIGGVSLPNPTHPDQPFPIYKEGTAELDKNTADYVWRAVKNRFADYPLGGSQSFHRMVEEEQLEDETWVDSRPLYPHDNWGSVTKESQIQMSRSVNDVDTHPDPSVTVYEVPPDMNDITVIACSDGVGDFSHYFEIGDACRQMVEAKPDVTGQEMADAYIRHMLLRNKKTFSVKNGVPRWDDLSIVISRIVRA